MSYHWTVTKKPVPSKKWHRKRSSVYLVEKIDSSNCADFGSVVDETYVSLCSRVQLLYFNVTEASQKLGPNIRPDSVANSDPHFVVLVIVFLQRMKSALIQTSASDLPQNNKNI